MRQMTDRTCIRTFVLTYIDVPYPVGNGKLQSNILYKLSSKYAIMHIHVVFSITF